VSDITIVRQQPHAFTEDELATARRVIFGMVDGLGERGKRQWRRFWNRLLRLEPGEMVDIRTHQERLSWFHKKHMATEQAIFDSQDKFETFEAFRTWLKVGAGFVDWHPGPKGGVIPVPRSISYAKLEQGDMEAFHEAAVAFLRTEHAGRTLWKHLNERQRIEMVEGLLARWEERA
jgi:hypothetical protein